jgi:hypothetical protein
MSSATEISRIPALVDQLCEIYDQSVTALRSALASYLRSGERPDAEERANGLFAYPELRIEYSHEQPPEFPTRAFGRLNRPGKYSTSVARPHFFKQYLIEQLELLVRDYQVEVTIGRSASEIPYPYVLDGSSPISATRSPTAPGIISPTSRARSRCSTVREWTSAWRASAIIPARPPSTPSATCSSPTMFATLKSSSAGRPPN